MSATEVVQFYLSMCCPVRLDPDISSEVMANGPCMMALWLETAGIKSAHLQMSCQKILI